MTVTEDLLSATLALEDEQFEHMNQHDKTITGVKKKEEVEKTHEIPVWKE